MLFYLYCEKVFDSTVEYCTGCGAALIDSSKEIILVNEESAHDYLENINLQSHLTDEE